MTTIFEPTAYQNILKRLNHLQANSQRQWGKMNAAQMLAHCHAALMVTSGKIQAPRLFIGRILGPIFKKSFLGEKPIKKNSPTDKSFIITDERDFNTEKEQLLQLLHEFVSAGEANATKAVHPFFGSLTPQERGALVYTHLDHHLQQFGV